MKAIAIEKFGKPGVFKLIEASTPAIGEKELLIEVVAGSVNPIDWKQRRGNHRFLFGAPFPIVLGYDISGIVVKKGSQVREFSIGDRICGVLNNKYGGGLGQFARGRKTCFASVPDSIDLAASAVLPLAGLTALQALRDKANIAPAKKIIIIGAAGGVGHYALQIASLFQAIVFAVSSNSHKNFLNKLAPHTFIDYRETDVLNLNERFDIIFDTVGKYSFMKCRHLLNPGGIYINTLPRPIIYIHKMFALFTHGKKVKTLLMKHNPKDLQLLLRWVVEGKLKLSIDKEFNVNDINNAHEYSEAGHTEGKILIRYNW